MCMCVNEGWLQLCRVVFVRAFAVSQYEHLYVCRGFEVVSQPCLSPPLSRGENRVHGFCFHEITLIC